MPTCSTPADTHYGFLQINGYRYKQRHNEPYNQKWITLSKDAKVHSYPCTTNEFEQSAELSVTSKTSCIAGSRKLSSDVRPQQRVRFGGDVDDLPDRVVTNMLLGLFVGLIGMWACGLLSFVKAGALAGLVGGLLGLSLGALLGGWVGDMFAHEDAVMSDEKTEWIYVDRDICGMSLHEYAPQCGDFSSSEYGRDFEQELRALHRECARSAEERCEADKEESLDDQKIQKALGLAQRNSRKNEALGKEDILGNLKKGRSPSKRGCASRAVALWGMSKAS